MEGKITQRDRVLDYIRTFGSISSRDAFVDLGVTQLAARICELSDRGYVFEKKYESSKNRYGESVSFVRYSLKEVS